MRLHIQRPSNNALAGLTFIAFGAAFALGATAFHIGDPVRPGPGFYPLMIGVLLAVLGLAIVVRREAEEEDGPTTAPSWRAVAAIVGALLVFALTIRGAGLVPSVFAAAFLASLASRSTGILSGFALAVGLTVLSVLIFVVALSLRLPLLGTWFPRL